eukprot:TRINITY_DN7702_c0_g1_i1.p1 TRINITY_DN7702_c0_g1~~TRINITY_DN7702_c0_g1_i1.p1  ORF type:complete len:164 (-),score=67.99 TRINITY_DN7702_c0_g1_i1:467-958(-)
MTMSQKAKAMRSLYNSSTDTDSVISDNYAPNCVFQDPLLKVKGISNVKAQFRLLKVMLKRIDDKFISSGVAAGEAEGTSIITHIMVLRPLLWPWDINIEVTTHMRVDRATGLICEHTDHWSVASLLANVPLLNRLADVSRTLFGTVSSMATHLLLPERKQHGS